jgi:NADP-dependent 3-hydroxy acid dehydrogenase YdfG
VLQKIAWYIVQVPIHSVTLDMRNLEAVAQLPHQLPAEFQEVDILINNAGLALGVTTVGDHDIEVC